METLANATLILAISCLLLCGQGQGRTTEDSSFLCLGREKVVKLHFYVQDLRIGHVNATVFEVAKASITPNSRFAFGSVHVLDDLVTAGPEFGSPTLGRTQGLTTNSDLSMFGIAMNLNFVFTAGRYNGSTLSILGRNQVADAARELPVVGGTGAFRYARGYAIQTTYSMDFPSSYAVLEYTIYTTVDSNSRISEDDVEAVAMM